MIFLIDLNKIEPHFHKLLELVGQKRKQKIQNERSKTSKLCHLGSGLLYAYILGNNYEDIVKFSDHGKPYVDNGPFFNVSHSGDYAILYVGENECGIDIEKINDNKTAVSSKIFSDEEIKWIEKNKTKNFFYAWTRKESISKTIGYGLAYPFKNIPIFNDKSNLKHMDIYTETISFGDYIISVSEENKTPDMNIKELEICDLL